MIEARRRLVGQVRGMFESELFGLYRWSDVRLDEVEKAPERLPDGRRNPMKYLERVVLRFGDDFSIDVQSAEEKPPLGLVRLLHRGAVQREGPLDAAVWRKIGDTIKELRHERAG